MDFTGIGIRRRNGQATLGLGAADLRRNETSERSDDGPLQ
jgi:hypothetical protein